MYTDNTLFECMVDSLFSDIYTRRQIFVNNFIKNNMRFLVPVIIVLTVLKSDLQFNLLTIRIIKKILYHAILGVVAHYRLRML